MLSSFYTASTVRATILIAVGCIMSMYGYAAGMAQPRWQYAEPTPRGPVKSIMQESRQLLLGQFFEGRQEYTFHLNGRLATYRAAIYHESYDENGVLVEIRRKEGDGYVYDDVIDPEQGLAKRHFRTTDFTHGFGVVRRTGRNKDVFEYSYDEQGRLMKVSLVSHGERILRKTVYHDGLRRGFDSPYYISFDRFLSQSVTGHEEIEVYDGDALVFVARRRRLTGDLKPPHTIEKAEAEVELVEYLFDGYGNETCQINSVAGEDYIHFETEYTEFDDFGNWLHRTTTAVSPGGERRLQLEQHRQITYYE